MTTLYGGTAADMLFTIDPVTGDVKPAAGGTAGVWTAPAGGQAITNLQDASGNAVTHVTAAADGTYGFGAPDGLGTLYVDSGLPSGSRFACQPTALATTVLGLLATAGDASALDALTSQVAALTAIQTAQATTIDGHTSTIGTLTATQATQAAVITGLQQAVAALQAGGTTTSTAPAAPTGFTGTANTDGSVDLFWTESTPAGQLAHFSLSYPGASADLIDQNADTEHLTGLPLGSPITFSLVAVAADGTTTSAAATTTLTPSAATASAPSNVAVTAGDTQALVTATAPTDNTAPITNFAARYRVSPGGDWSLQVYSRDTTPSVMLTGLVNGTAYDIDVQAVMTSTGGTFSDPVTVTPGPTGYTASAPAGVTVTATDPDGFSLTLTPPSDNTGPITDYAVHYRTDPDGPWATATPYGGPNTQLPRNGYPGLTTGTAYDFEAAAVMIGTPGAWSDPVSMTAIGPVPVTADAPTGVTATPTGSGEITVAWTATASSSEPVTHYRVQSRVSPSGDWTVQAVTAADELTAAVDGLTPGTAYDFDVYAQMNDGYGTLSDPVTATPTA